MTHEQNLNQRIILIQKELTRTEKQITRIKTRMGHYYTWTDETYLNTHLQLVDQLQNEIFQLKKKLAVIKTVKKNNIHEGA
jgi:hypothetical protein